MQITAQINPTTSYTIQGDVLQQILSSVAIQAVEAYIARNTVVEDRLLTTDEALAFLGISGKATLISYHSKYGLPYIKGCPNQYYLSDLKDCLKKKMVK